MDKTINFGTDGIRGKTGQHPFKKDALIFIGMAIAQWGIKKYKKDNPKILIAGDTRKSFTQIKSALISGLSNFPLHIIDGKILPTPAVCQLIQKSNKNFDFGIVISASHNPYQDNGIKLFDAKETKLGENDEDIIADNFSKLANANLTIKKHDLAIYEEWNDASIIYQKHILSFFNPNFLNGTKVVLDCANGATYKIAQNIFKILGAQVITTATNPNGTNINLGCGALYPERLQELVILNKADIGFAFDGDGDRLITVNKNGQIKDGDDSLAILLNHPQFINEKEIVGTIVTNYGFESFLAQKNKKLIRTAVGDKHIATKLEQNNLLLGGENSGHIIMKDYMGSGDGVFVALRILQTLLLTDNLEMKTFEKTPQICINIPVAQKKDLSCNPFAQIIQKQKNILKEGRLVVRYSGTENLLRIMVEDKDTQTAKNVAVVLANELKQAIE